MLKNRALQVKVVKEEDPSTYDIIVGDHTDAIKDLIVESAKPMATAVALVIGAKTLSAIAIHAAKIYIR